MQLIVLPCGAAAMLIIAGNTLGAWLGSRHVSQISPFVALVGYSMMVWGLASYRVFDFLYLAKFIAQKTSVAIVLITPVLLSIQLISHKSRNTATSSIAALFGGLLALAWDKYSSTKFSVSTPGQIARLRDWVLSESRDEAKPDILVARFQKILARSFRAPVVEFWFDKNLGLMAGDSVLIRTRPALIALRQMGWASPDSLQRRRANTDTADLMKFLVENGIGLAAVSPSGTAGTSFMITLGVRIDAWPYTYPDVQRLLAAVELIDGILSRARLGSQAALEARMAHLALMSRGLAHDLKNLITPISSFLVHTEGRFSPGTPEGEVYRDARRSVRLMTEYVREAHFFSSRLQPHLERIDIAGLFRRVHETVRAAAHVRGVNITLSAPSPIFLEGDGVLLQRLLVNLVQNALDASTAGGVVSLRAVALQTGYVRFEVSDVGSGISPEILPRVFEPYFTTKQFGEETRGFGLGLAIVEKIAHLHYGSVRVAITGPSGTTFTVDLPATQ